MTQFKMVPVEPTAEMLDVKHEDGDGYAVSADEYYFSDRDSVHGFMRYVYSRMLAAAPSPWVSVEHDLPKAEEDSTESASVIVCLNDCVRSVGFYCHFENEWYGEDGHAFEEASNGMVTHWMPLPTPPEKSE